MLKTIFSKVMWVGKATTFTIGLAVIVALTVGVATTALAGNGDPFKLGKSNTASKVSKLIKSGAGPALQLQVDSGAPLAVNSDEKVTNLNADSVDGLDSTQLQGAPAYAHINADGTLDSSRSKNVDRSIKFPGLSVYCLNSTVQPHNVVATIDHVPGGPGEFGELVKNSDNGATMCTAGTTTYNIVVNTANSAGTAEDRAFDIVIN